MKFAWDIDKEELNRRKHKIVFIESCFVFSDQYALTTFDSDHSIDEERWVTIGQIPKGTILVVSHTY